MPSNRLSRAYRLLEPALDEGAAQLEGVGKVVPEKLLREFEHVRGGQDGLAETVVHRLVAQAETVASDDLLGLGIPQDQLAVAIGGIGVELVDVQGFARAAAVVAEGDFTQPSDFPDDVHGFRADDIELVAGAVRFPQVCFLVEFRLQEFLVDGIDAAHSAGFRLPSKVCQGIGSPMTTR